MLPSLPAPALSLVAAGRRVFPCAPGAKVPLYANPHSRGSEERDTCRGECGAWGHGVLDATTDPEVIAVWWTRTPAANIGVACGRPGGPDVLDVDVKDGQPGVASLAKLRDAGYVSGAEATVRTPSGGLHVWFAGTDQGNGRIPRHGVDFRSTGGYVVAPPSVVNGNPYELIAFREPTGVTLNFAAVREFLAPPRPVRLLPATASATFDGLIRHIAEQGASSHNRNEALHWAASRAAEQGAGEAVFAALAAAAVSNGLSLAEAERTVHSARRRTGANL
ncbi:bifunctional DNA primase/polymerase [Phytohabitans sp. ZYX-F-186]|uniref:Bifunctional DNA primase/polymerase n=1 Tax=Phytohabitans maris TaxID=3071409 RepID=A0ABU0ZXS0_9ACTN|nr:bifunctional DNA primase/polymerase [Phytohabitans sp. ZYX-F-186]MDQ7910777.1 bifunctional DNA primase/polymerase [Phytohabitans sp. ZYX-F-186]